MHFSSRLPFFVLGLFLVSGARAVAQTEETLIAGRATVGIALTITQTIGGYQLTPAKLEAEAVKDIFYDGEMPPLDFDAEAAGFNHWSERTNTVRKKLADGDVYPVEQITQVVRKTLAQRYLTSDFIKDLIARGGVLDEAASDVLAWKGYGLVAVTFKGFDEDRRFFFAEKKGRVPVFVGWEKRADEAPALSAGMYLLAEASLGAAEAGTRKISQKTAYTVIKDGDFVLVEEDIFNPPPPTVTETFGGKTSFAAWIFPNGTGPFRDLRIAGKATYSARHDTKKDVRVNGKTSAGGLTGSQFVTYGTGDTAEARPEAVVEGSLTVGAEALLKTEAEAQVYWEAVPEALRF